VHENHQGSYGARTRGLYENAKDKVTIVKSLHMTFYDRQEFDIRDGNDSVLTFSSRP